MLTQTDLERERYEARRKAQLDYNTALKVARVEGLIEGKIDLIHLCQRLLNRPETPTEQLTRSSLEDLTRMADDLQAQLAKQR